MQRLEVSGAVRPIYGSLGVKRLNKLDQCFPHVFSRGPLLASKFTTDSHILGQVNTEFPDDRYPELYTYAWELILDSYKYITSRICNNKLRDLTLIKLIVARFVALWVQRVS